MDAESYTQKWDHVLIPVISLFILASLIGVYALNVVTSDECRQNLYVYCGDTQKAAKAEEH
jgi:hypothetical protein